MQPFNYNKEYTGALTFNIQVQVIKITQVKRIIEFFYLAAII